MNKIKSYSFVLTVSLLGGINTVHSEPLLSKPLNITSPHCEQSKSNAPVIYLNLAGLKGPIQFIKMTAQNGSQVQYKIDPNGKIASYQSKNKDEAEFSNIDLFSYDNEGRLALIKGSNSFTTGISLEQYSYPDPNTVISQSSWVLKDGGDNRWKVEMSTRQKNSNGDEVCVYAMAIKYTGLYQLNKTIKKKDGSYQYLMLNFDNYKGDISNQSMGVGAVTAAIKYAFTLNDTDEECISAQLCSTDEPSRDGDFIKHVRRSVNWSSKKNQIDSIGWSDASGNEFDFILAFDKDLSNGKRPHHMYKYQFDNHGNWLVRTPIVEFDSPKGIKVKEERASESREIQYYN